MKTRLYGRIARGRNGVKADAALQPRHRPLSERYDGVERDLPTVEFAIELTVPDELLDPGKWPSTPLELEGKRITLIEARQDDAAEGDR